MINRVTASSAGFHCRDIGDDEGIWSRAGEGFGLFNLAIDDQSWAKMAIEIDV